MAETSLDKELHHEGLVLDLGEFPLDLAFELACFFGSLNLGNAANVFSIGERLSAPANLLGRLGGFFILSPGGTGLADVGVLFGPGFPVSIENGFLFLALH